MNICSSRKKAMKHNYCMVCGVFSGQDHSCDLSEAEIAQACRLEAAVLLKICHDEAVKSGWWTDIHTGESLRHKRNVPELLCLIHSEISEAMEGYRKDAMDDKLPHRKALEVELADALIRIFDLAGGYDLDIGGALAEKVAYNRKRADHKLENRRAEGGKRF